MMLPEGTDVCFRARPGPAEGHEHRHHKSRKTFIKAGGVRQLAPAPRFSRTPAAFPEPPAEMSLENAIAALSGWLPDSTIAALANAGAFNQETSK
jgi:crotonobetainyl-CoA:carnitine CoA-transferase CaiB-like acyl-CoA transferase